MATHRVLQFRIGEEYYCVSVVETDHVTRVEDPRTVPNSPEFSIGVIDIEEITGTIELLNPSEAFEIRGEQTDDQYVVVLSENYQENGRRLGWVVDEVLTVEEVTREEVDDSVDETGVIGSVEINDETTIWLDPGVLFDLETDYVTD